MGLLSGKRPNDLGVRNGNLKPPPSSPNAVSSQTAGGYHQIAPLTYKATREQAMNTLKAIVTRQVYLGMNRDYMVETSDGTSLRVTTPTGTAVEKGREVWLTLPPERCRALSR